MQRRRGAPGQSAEPAESTASSASAGSAGWVLISSVGADEAALRSLATKHLEIAQLSTLESVNDASADAADASRALLDARPCVLLLDAALAAPSRVLETIARLPEHLVLLVRGEEARQLAAQTGRFFLPIDLADDEARTQAVRAAALHSLALLSGARAKAQCARMSGDLETLNQIGMALMSEREPDRLLEMILSEARRLTGSDAGSLYLVEENSDGARELRFLLTQNHSLPQIAVPKFALAIDRSSLAGYAAATGQAIVLDDAYQIPVSEPYTFHREFDQKFGYRAKSMLVVPMLDHLGDTVGVLQLVNRKRDAQAVIRDEASAAAHVIPYTPREVDLVRSLSGQAAVSIENSRLYQSIEALFEGFIKAAVIAIDQRDPTTSGHSVRVAELTCDIASAIDRAAHGVFREARFSRAQLRELRYASLLHDFGKVGVREEVLVKAKKLPPILHERLIARFKLLRSLAQGRFHEAQAKYLRANGNGDFETFLAKLRASHDQELQQIDRFFAAIEEANLPRVLPEQAADVLQEIASFTFHGLDGSVEPYLTDEEVRFLSIARGSLNEAERREIESHVSQTFRFLEQIPWTKDLSRVAEIAYGHHEKIDGSGYPRGIVGAEISLQSRIMTVSDIFDALTASDRPYKASLPCERALDILQMEAEQGKIDTEVLRVMIESRAYRKILDQDWRSL